MLLLVYIGRRLVGHDETPYRTVLFCVFGNDKIDRLYVQKICTCCIQTDVHRPSMTLSALPNNKKCFHSIP
jgi:hypothetical protein